MITTGNQVMSGNDVNIDELGSVSSDLYDEVSKTSWASARSIQAEMGENPTGPDIPPSAKPSQVNEKPGFFKAIDSIPGVGVACNSVTQGILSLVSIGDTVKDAIIGFITSTFGITRPEDFLAEQLVRFIAGEEVNTLAEGAELGNYANYGARLAANDEAIASGGRELTNTEVSVLDSVNQRGRVGDFAHQSLYAKVFNIYDVNSVLGKATLRMPRTTPQAVATMVSAPLRIFSFLVKPVHAQATYEYGFSEYGFSLSEQNDTRFEDPFSNAVIVEPNLETRVVKNSDGSETKIPGLNEKYGTPCFGMEIREATGELVYGEAKNFSDIPAKCKDSTNEELLRYRFYITDTITEHTLSCYEGEEAPCQQLGI
jgi:hypothetical protein